MPPLIGFHRRGEEPVIVPAPGGTQEGLHNYIGSVAADSSGSIVAASAPKGGLTSGEGWLATADSSGALERQASSFQWDNHAILVR